MEAQRGSWLKTYEAVDPGFHAPRCHATTLVETQHGLLLAFFGGDGLVNITYTAGRGWTGMRHLEIDPAGL